MPDHDTRTRPTDPHTHAPAGNTIPATGDPKATRFATIGGGSTGGAVALPSGQNTRGLVIAAAAVVAIIVILLVDL